MDTRPDKKKKKTKYCRSARLPRHYSCAGRRMGSYRWCYNRDNYEYLRLQKRRFADDPACATISVAILALKMCGIPRYNPRSFPFDSPLMGVIYVPACL